MVRRHRNKQRLQVLRNVSLLSDCDDKELLRIASLSSEVVVPAGRTIARQGESGSEFVIVVDGKAVASRDGSELAVLRSSSAFVDPALLDGGVRTATVTATTDLRVLVLSRGEFVRLSYSCPMVAYRIMQSFGRQLKWAYERLDSVTEDRLGETELMTALYARAAM